MALVTAHLPLCAKQKSPSALSWQLDACALTNFRALFCVVHSVQRDSHDRVAVLCYELARNTGTKLLSCAMLFVALWNSAFAWRQRCALDVFAACATMTDLATYTYTYTPLVFISWRLALRTHHLVNAQRLSDSSSGRMTATNCLRDARARTFVPYLACFAASFLVRVCTESRTEIASSPTRHFVTINPISHSLPAKTLPRAFDRLFFFRSTLRPFDRLL